MKVIEPFAADLRIQPSAHDSSGFSNRRNIIALEERIDMHAPAVAKRSPWVATADNPFPATSMAIGCWSIF
jgi:hypothetical protein